MFTCSVDSTKGKQSVNIYHFRIMNCFWFHIKYVEVCGWNQPNMNPTRSRVGLPAGGRSSEQNLQPWFGESSAGPDERLHLNHVTSCRNAMKWGSDQRRSTTWTFYQVWILNPWIWAAAALPLPLVFFLLLKSFLHHHASPSSFISGFGYSKPGDISKRRHDVNAVMSYGS